MDDSINDILVFLSRKKFTNFIELPNLNARPGRRYFLSKYRENKIGIVKITFNDESDSEITTKILRELNKLNLDAPKLIYFGRYKKCKIIVTNYLPGNTIKKATYLPIHPEYITPLRFFCLEHFRLFTNQKPKKIISLLGIRNEEYFLDKLDIHLTQLSAVEKVLEEDLLNFRYHILAKFKLLSDEISLQHGDFYGSNIVYDAIHNKFNLIDWDSIFVTSRYFDIATFLAKELTTPQLVSDIYTQVFGQLNSRERVNFNIQILLALIKEYRNICTLENEFLKITSLKKYRSTLQDIISQNLALYDSVLDFKST